MCGNVEEIFFFVQRNENYDLFGVKAARCSYESLFQRRYFIILYKQLRFDLTIVT